MRVRPTAVLTFVFVPLLALGCKPKAGDKCNAGFAVCGDPSSALVCINGVLSAMPCRGATACSTKGNTVQCDNSLAKEGDTCDEQGDYACSVEKTSALECDKQKFIVSETCKGIRGCETKGDKIMCDNDVADAGDPCAKDNDYACTPDKKLLLKCENHKFTPLNSCRGTNSCRVMELVQENKTEFVCDDTMAQENDPCDEANEEACTMNKKSLMVCKANKFVPAKTCAGGCSFDERGERFACAGPSAGEAGGTTVPAAATTTGGLTAKGTKAAALPPPATAPKKKK